jgi:hypothetical protein
MVALLKRPERSISNMVKTLRKKAQRPKSATESNLAKSINESNPTNAEKKLFKNETDRVELPILVMIALIFKPFWFSDCTLVS